MWDVDDLDFNERTSTSTPEGKVGYQVLYFSTCSRFNNSTQTSVSQAERLGKISNKTSGVPLLLAANKQRRHCTNNKLVKWYKTTDSDRLGAWFK